jgi:heterotetrameric sarcosine oxidase alpha subunit
MSSKISRLTNAGLVDHNQPLRFTFDGKAHTGYAGDTLASALLGDGVRLVGRSFKYHRPRGVMTAGPEEPNALVELREGARREPNCKATTVELFDGLVARSQNRWPSLDFDVGAVNGLFSPLLVAGFYYKTFKWPAAFWEKLYEPAIRRAAGLGRSSGLADPDTYEKAFAFCDVLVIGSGPAGLAAALAAGRSGARTILCDEDFSLGGRLLAERDHVDGLSAAAWASRTVQELQSLANVTLMPRTAVFGAYDGGTFGAIEKVSDHLLVPAPNQPRQRLWQIVAKRSVLAAGAVERPLVFSGNDRPGVMLASAVRSYLGRFGVVPGHQASVFTNGDDGWRTAFDLAEAGAAIEAIIDARATIDPALVERAKRLGARVVLGGRVTATHGGKALSEISFRTADGTEKTIPTDLLAVSGGWNPALALSTHLGSRPGWSDTIAAFVPGAVLPPGMQVAGAANGSLSLGKALAEGHAAGLAAANATGFDGAAGTASTADDESVALTALWHFEGKGKAFVDFQHDVTAADIALAHREGFRSVELLKRYTTLGMATDQGKLSNVNGHAIMAELVGKPIPEVGTTIARPPYAPVAIAAFAGHSRGKHFRPTRLTAGHAYAASQGASFVETGAWLRPQWFTRSGEKDWLESVSREANNVRENVGICDVSTLGKIDVQGPDAATFLDRLYVNGFAKLSIGKARYGVMLREDGFVLDDGTTAHLGPEHFLVSTTTANAARIMKHMNFAAQVLWPELDVQLASVTEAWAQMAVAGPKSRKLLEALFGEAVDLSNEAFPFMAVASFEWAGVPVRLFRISFSGELAYEVAVPADYGDALARRLAEAGKPFGAMPYGTEALGVLRVEKGHVAGNELSGTTTAGDLGLGKMMSTKKDFIGKRLAAREGLVAEDRLQFVGFKPVDPSHKVSGGVHFVRTGAEPTTANDDGYVTSVAFSPALGQWIGLGLLKRGPERIGERMRAVDLLRRTEVEIEICSPHFVDPEGKRHHA